MSTNKTINLKLHSWIDDDFVEVNEINENFTKIDTEIGGAKQKINETETALQQLNSNLPGLLQQTYDKTVKTYSSDTYFLITLQPGQVFVIDPFLDESDYKNFDVVLSGNGTKNKNLGVHITGNDEVVKVVGSMAAFPSNDVTRRYTSSGAWHYPAVTTTDYSIFKALVGFNYDMIPTIPGCGVFENEFYSPLVDSIASTSMDIQLLGISIEGNRLCFIFKNHNPNEAIQLSTSVAFKVSK